MKQPVNPADENERLEMLKSLHILDTPSEERFDRITRLAKRMFNVPIASVSLIDEHRQWFKSCVGVDFREGERKNSFCGHTILSKDVLVVPCASQSELFFDNPLVVGEPKVEFYAGCPLVVNGFRLGTLCIVDHHARSFNEEDILALKDLAATVELELSAIQIATHDQLTGLLNRRGFLSLAQNMLNINVRNKTPVALVYFDLDNFKTINDSFGHSVGDQVLEAFSRHLSHSFRDIDIIGRLGGDEFAVVLNNTSKVQADLIIDKFICSLQTFLLDEVPEPDIHFSFGIVEFESAKHKNIDGLLEETDQYMYVCKETKK